MRQVNCLLVWAPPATNLGVSLNVEHDTIEAVDPIGRAVVMSQPVHRLTQIDVAGAEVQLLFLAPDGVFDLVLLRCRDGIEASQLATSLSQTPAQAGNNAARQVVIHTHQPGFFDQ